MNAHTQTFLHPIMSFLHSVHLSLYGETALILFIEASLFLSSFPPSLIILFSSAFPFSSPNAFLQISISPTDIYKPLCPTLTVSLSLLYSLVRSLSLSVFPTGLCYLIFLKRSRCHSPLKPVGQRPKSSPLSMGHAP